MGWFVFEPSTTRIARFLKRGFGHLFFLSRDEYSWYTFNPLERHLDFQILGATLEIAVEKIALERATKVIEIEYRPKVIGKKSYKWLAPSNCVTVMQYLVGLNGFSFTPYHFYKQLRRMEAARDYPAHIQRIRELR